MASRIKALVFLVAVSSASNVASLDLPFRCCALHAPGYYNDLLARAPRSVCRQLGW